MIEPSNEFDINLVQLEVIKILKASLENEQDVTNLPVGCEKDMSFKINPLVDRKRKKVRFVFDCSIKALSEGSREQLGVSAHFEIGFNFVVPNLEEIASLEDEEGKPVIVVPEEMITSLVNVVYSSARGIIFTRCSGTMLDPMILPILSTEKILGNM